MKTLTSFGRNLHTGLYTPFNTLVVPHAPNHKVQILGMTSTHEPEFQTSNPKKFLCFKPKEVLSPPHPKPKPEAGPSGEASPSSLLFTVLKRALARC